MSHTIHKEVLISLAQHCLDLTKAEFAQDDPPFRRETRMRMSCTSFEYSESGVKAPSRGSTVEVLDWGHAFHILLELVRKSKQWKDAAAALVPSVDNSVELDHILERFCQRQILPLLGRGGLKTLSPEVAAVSLIHEFAGKPMEYRVSASIEGLVLLGVPISIEFGGAHVHIRPTAAQDLVYEQSAFSVSNRWLLSIPTAILTVARIGQGQKELQSFMNCLLSAFRLHQVCSAHVLSAQFDSDAVRGLGGSGVIHMSAPKSAAFMGVIRPSEVEHLKLLIQTIVPILLDFYSHVKSDSSLSIALKRYEDTLLDTQTFDRRILGATMALEAVMLSSDEMQELGFKLRVRTARLLSYFGHDPERTQACLKLAYRIRSKYVHGDLSSPRDKRKVAKCFCSEADFIREVLNIVRTTLLIMFLVPASKGELIESLDSALIGAEVEKTEEMLAMARKYAIG